jgi:hypothetical protein
VKRKGFAVAPAALLLLLIPQRPASAAMRVCGDVIARAGEDRGSERMARQRAMEQWIAAAAAVGPAFSRWQLAIGRSLSCLVLPDGTHRCQAYAQPCGISQVPGGLPPGTADGTYSQRRMKH